jgi:hypothetical protein
MKSSADDLPPATATPRSRRITRSAAAQSLSPTTTMPPFTPPPRRHVARLDVTPQHGGTPAPTLANFYEPIDNDLIDEDDLIVVPPPGGDLLTFSQNSPSLLTPPSPREEHNTTETPTLAPPIPTTGFVTAPEFLAPTDFGAPVDLGNPALAANTTRVRAISSPTLTDLDRILATIGGINARFDKQNADINARFDGVTARFDALGGRLQAFGSLGPRIDALVEHVTTNDGVLGDLDKRVTDAESLSPHLTDLDARVTTTVDALGDLDDRITTTTDLISDAITELDERVASSVGALDKRVLSTADIITATTTRLDAQMKQVDVVATDKLIEYGSRLADYGSRLGHFTNTVIPKHRSDLDACETRVTTVEGRPPNRTPQDVRHGDTSSHASVADDDSDNPWPPNVDNDQFSAIGLPPIIGVAHLSPAARSRMAWAEVHNTRAPD